LPGAEVVARGGEVELGEVDDEDEPVDGVELDDGAVLDGDVAPEDDGDELDGDVELDAGGGVVVPPVELFGEVEVVE
jgi:hypothetical protein